MVTPYYDHDGIVIYHGDCRDVLPALGTAVDVLVSDPPYGMDLGSHKGVNDKRPRELRRQAYANYVDSVENYRSTVVPAIGAAVNICERGAVFGYAPPIWELPAPDAVGGVFIPAATGRSPWGFQNIALVCFYGVAPDLHLGAAHTTVKRSGRADVETIGHPCPKPIEWMTWLVGLTSRESETVLDPFMGSGTTLVAAKQLGRRAIGIEIEERYCEIAAKRLAQGVLL